MKETDRFSKQRTDSIDCCRKRALEIAKFAPARPLQFIFVVNCSKRQKFTTSVVVEVEKLKSEVQDKKCFKFDAKIAKKVIK